MLWKHGKRPMTNTWTGDSPTCKNPPLERLIPQTLHHPTTTIQVHLQVTAARSPRLQLHNACNSTIPTTTIALPHGAKHPSGKNTHLGACAARHISFAHHENANFKMPLCVCAARNFDCCGCGKEEFRTTSHTWIGLSPVVDLA
jgi:hypothetical protein